MKLWLKILSASLASWLFLIALGILISGIHLWGGSQSPASVVFSLLVALLACYGLAWVNTKSYKHSFLGALGGIFVGVPLSFLLLIPVGYWLADRLFPLSNLNLSDSLSGAWLLLAVVVTVEILTDRVFLNRGWLMILLGSLVLMTLVYVIELITVPAGSSSNSSLLKLVIYAPLIWGGIVGFVNMRSFIHEHSYPGGKNE